MKCLYCYQELQEGQTDYHPACAKKIYESPKPPQLLYVRTEITKLAEQVIRSQVTVTGVQPKLSLDVLGRDANMRLTIVGLWGKYILKPQTELYPQLPENEDLTLHLAETVKIKTVPHSLIRFADGELCYITKRIDRDTKGDKLPMEDFCQLTERLTEHKYKSSYEQIAGCILKYSAAPKLDLANFWEQVIFCFLTGNSDMHLKNFSLYSPRKGMFQLTPAYDMLSTALVIPEDKEEVALSLNGRKNKFSWSDFEKASQQSGLAPKVLKNIMDKFRRIVPEWDALIDISFLSDEMKENYKNLIKTRAERIFQ